ncbi:MAG: hypothetical protein RCH30_2590 [Candidatus Phytoplasma australasiaticum]|nr:hypothetical protein EPWB_v2c3530 ['Echinacea purpurea' witches'-broom phytoplasma]WKV64172.1 MAG: hypothetical protein NCHU2022_c3300 [Candidatus Phytoplasma australasiaticum]WMW50070.1 MAG: hypothetical protein RCH30_1770 [Candidatus Phytoplasma australasiaticum]WMW50147.1 MAG: hypothetical protein RCH30_2590 [Candidatus Phytoplasma australasiaticum]
MSTTIFDPETKLWRTLNIIQDCSLNVQPELKTLD